MSRLFNCGGRVQRERMDDACSYMLGLLIFFNDGSKKSKIMGKVQESGYSPVETYQALTLLSATNLVETTVSGCLKRNTNVELTEYARSMPMGRLFEELQVLRQQDKNEERAKSIAIDGAKHLVSRALP